MKIKKYVLPLALAISASSAMANYTWYYRPFAAVGPFDSPYELCNSLGADIMNMNPVHLITWGATSLGRCKDPGGTQFFRSGSGCDAGKSYDHKQMSCEPDEPNKRPSLCEGGIVDIMGQCDPQANPEPISASNQCDNPEILGNPIIIATGQKVEMTTDIELPHSLLTFSRNYWSSRLFADHLGLAWQHNWQMKIETLQSRDRIKLYRNNGRGIIFTPRNGRWESDSSDTEVITKLANDQGWEVQSKGGVIELYNNLGQLINYSKKGYPTVTLNYNANGQLTTLTEASGRNLTLTYNANNQITNVVSNIGLSVSYTYDSQNRLIQLTQAGNSKTYHYENSQYPNLLTGITDERGVRYATWTYNDKGQAISSEHAGGADKYQFEYLVGNKTRVTNPLGKSATYSFQDIRLEKKITKIEGEPLNTCIATKNSYSYNAEGLVVSETTKNNSTITYQYNDRGLQTERAFSSSGLNYKIYTKWHDTLPLPIEVNHNGQRQTYQYDSDGRLVKYSDGTNDSGITDPVYDSTLLQFNDFTDPASNLWIPHNNPQIVADPEAIGGNALYLDGNSYLTTDSLDIMNFGTGEFTIEFWIKPIDKGEITSTILTTLLTNTVNNVSFNITIGGPTSSDIVSCQYYLGSSSNRVVIVRDKSFNLYDGNWHHIAIVRGTAKNPVIYIDGKNTNATAYNGSWMNLNIVSFVGTMIGGRYDRDTQRPSGYLDQIRVIKKVIYTEDFTPSKEPYVYEAIE